MSQEQNRIKRIQGIVVAAFGSLTMSSNIASNSLTMNISPAY